MTGTANVANAIVPEIAGITLRPYRENAVFEMKRDISEMISPMKIIAIVGTDPTVAAGIGLQYQRYWENPAFVATGSMLQ